MADKFIQVPSNIEDPLVLKRFLVELVDKLSSNASVAYPILYPDSNTAPLAYYDGLSEYTNTILEATARLDKLSGDAKNYITGSLEKQVLANSQDISTISTEWGTFYNNATAAAWYGLTVKTGELISGFTVGSVDTDTTTPGTAGSFFTISADKFSVGRAIEDITDPAELAYVQANNLPYGTMYNATTSSIVPAFLIEWTGTAYDIFFNGKVSFTNVTEAPLTNKVLRQADPPSGSLQVNDVWIDTNDYNRMWLWTGSSWSDYSLNPAGVINQGTTTINGGKITSYSIGADQIATNTIVAGSGIIADLAVGTLKIANRAITVPVVVTSTTAVYGNGSPQIVLTASIDLTVPAPIQYSFTAEFLSTSGTATGQVSIHCNGSYNRAVTVEGNRACFAINGAFDGNAGTNTVVVYFTASSADGRYIDERSLTLMGAMK